MSEDRKGDKFFFFDDKRRRSLFEGCKYYFARRESESDFWGRGWWRKKIVLCIPGSKITRLEWPQKKKERIRNLVGRRISINVTRCLIERSRGVCM
jgi:hypothetical protein